MIAEQDVWSTEKSSSKVIDAKYFKHEGSQLKTFVRLGWAKEVVLALEKEWGPKYVKNISSRSLKNIQTETNQFGLGDE